MKKIFTLLFCVVAMGLAANAEESLIDQCINALLTQDQNTTLRSATLDANNDGVLTIADVTTLIDMNLMAQQINRAPAKKTDVQTVINQVLQTETGEPNINDVQEAVDQNIKQDNKQQ